MTLIPSKAHSYACMHHVDFPANGDRSCCFQVPMLSCVLLICDACLRGPHRRKFDFSDKMGLAPDFAERVSGFREAAGPDYNRYACMHARPNQYVCRVEAGE